MIANNGYFEIYINAYDRNFWVETWGLTAALIGIDDSVIINRMSKQPYKCYELINYIYGCAVEHYISREDGVTKRIVWNFKGTKIFEEEDEVNWDTDEHTNPDFNKKDIYEILALKPIE
jgi:hypothetical protein